METQPEKITDTTIYWIQIAITIIFGMLTYYLVVYLPHIDFGSGLWGVTGNFYLFFIIFITTLIFLPFLLLRFKTKRTLWQCFVLPARGVGVQMPIYFFLLTIIYILNI